MALLDPEAQKHTDPDPQDFFLLRFSTSQTVNNIPPIYDIGMIYDPDV
jgi:hypothetical protein